MINNAFLVVFLTFYISLTIGVAIRFYEKKTPFLIIFAPIIPGFIFLLDLFLSIDSLFESKKKLKNRVRCIIFGVTCFPVYIALTVKIMADIAMNKALKTLICKIFDFSFIWNIFELIYEQCSNICNIDINQKCYSYKLKFNGHNNHHIYTNTHIG